MARSTFITGCNLSVFSIIHGVFSVVDFESKEQTCC